MVKFGIGQAGTRLEDQRFLTGHGSYTDDINLDKQAYGVVVRSPHAYARFTTVDTLAATKSPGVLAVYTAEHIKAAGLSSLPFAMAFETNLDGSKVFSPEREILASRVVRHVGNPVAFVVAETQEQAKDAAELVEINYEPLEPITDTKRATEVNAPQIWSDAPNNVAFSWEQGNRELTDEAFKKASHIVQIEVVNNRIVANSMEPRVAIGQWDGYRYTLYSPTQGVHFTQSSISKILGVELDQIRVVTPDVGGSFGMKTMAYHEPPLVLFASRALNRPIKWINDRSESFVSDNQGRDHVSRAEIALDASAKFLGIRVHTIGNLGAYYSSYAMYIPTSAGVKLLSGVYAVPTVYAEVTGVFTNTVPVDAYRGAGRPEAIYLVERLVDAAARKLRLDPADLRKRNFIPKDAMPYDNGIGNTYDCGDFPRMMKSALESVDYDKYISRKEKAHGEGKLRGLGYASYVENCGGGNEKAKISVDSSGTITLFIGTQAIGQGIATSYTQVIAEHLGIENNNITVIQGDTDLVSTGNGTGGSKSMPVGGVACERAAIALIENGKRLASEVLEASVSDIEFFNGVFSVVGTDRHATLAQVANAAANNPDLNNSEDIPGLFGNGEFSAESSTFPNGCHICEVEIDRETGSLEIISYSAVDDIGTVVNPLLAGGQIVGGIVQGIGQAVHEECVYDTKTGQLLTGSYMDYQMPRAADIPSISLNMIDDIPCTTNPLGIKGAGEVGSIGAPAVVVHAVLNALEDFDVSTIDMPVTSEKIWRLINHQA